MSARGHLCRWNVLVASLFATIVHPAFARPQLAPSSATASIAPPFSNASISPLPADGSCGKCGIEAPGGIRLVYWEPDSAVVTGSNMTLAQNSAQAYTQVDNGFTYTSPSVYVIYSALRATATCSDSALHTIGPSFVEKTIAYSSRFLAYGTLSMPDKGCSEHVVVDGFHTIDFSSLYYNPIAITTTTKMGCAPYVNPRLSLPAELTNVDPSWKSCEPLFYGAFDPPSVLRKESGGLVPSPVGAGQVTESAVARPMLVSPPAQPVMTPAPALAVPTIGTGNGSPPPKQGTNVAPGNGGPPVDQGAAPSPIATLSQADTKNYLTLAAAYQSSQDNVQLMPSTKPDAQLPANLSPSAPPAGNVIEVTSHQSPDQTGNVPPSNSGQIGSIPIIAGNTNQVTPQESSQNPGVSPASNPKTLGDLINRPFTPIENGGKAAVVSAPGGNTALVAVPVVTSDGKHAYAVVAAQPPSSGGKLAPVNALPVAGASSGQQAPSDQSGRGGAGTSPGNNDGGSKAANPGGMTPAAGGNGAGPGGTTKVTLNDGTTADIPTANILEPAQPQGDVASGKPSPPSYQSVHLSTGALIVVSGALGSSSSVRVSGGDYLIPKPSANLPQQTLTLQGGKLTTVPVDSPSQAITLQGGKITTLPIDGPPHAVTLQNGEISTILPLPHATITLANGQVTTVPIADAAAGSGSSVTGLPQQILTLKGGKVTTAPIDIPAQTLTLEGGKVTTIAPNAPLQTFTLVNGQISTISPVPLTTVTLANGKVTAIPISTAASADQDANFVAVPETTISGKVYYTHLPIINVQNSGFNSSRNATDSTTTQTGLSGSATTMSTPTSNITKPNPSTTSGKTSSGSRLPSSWKCLSGLITLVLVCLT